MRRRRLIAVAAALALLATGMTAYATEGDGMNRAVADTGYGKVRGTIEAANRVFQGIPYAAPPVGERRWAPPAEPGTWKGVRDATKPGSPCPQLPTPYGGEGSLDEDCLFLNVTTPRHTKGPLPVMVWIHGNGSIGSGDVFDARRLAAQGEVVVVTLNYRMGVFGAYGHPDLPDSGTMGLQDQRAALTWVRGNIGAFGGDPANVTLFGVSFGATATAAHMVAPASRGLFDKAIMHSGFATMDAPAGALYPQLGAIEHFGWKTAAENRDVGAMVAAELGCEGPSALECLRGKEVEELLAYPEVMNIFQTYAFGNRELPVDPAVSLAEGDFANVPVMAGATRDEHRTFVAIRALSGHPMNETAYEPALRQAFGVHAEAVAAEYPLTDYDGNAGLAFAAVMTDRMWAKNIHRQNALIAARGPLYFFEFADREPPEEFPFPEDLPSGAYHNADISYLFRSPGFDGQLRPGQRELSDTMIAYWTAFARTGDPNTDGAPQWTPFGDDGTVQSLAPGDGGIAPVDYAEEHRLGFWAGLDS
ncbi:carboxylesterase/lipase family protein [Phytomonospora endophytica]|uniref:Para-nitrobenzyl esterase n=1 Tax=Phytomonospora endophytica TaxID=714109 RepID=A0A841FCE8_9ACTN|nr:carboxylesterase family protein [Phytomonospora endophytica]MBB6033946.1 para-nitrobenzyl esterase [Phytomonospora endophytica]GIG64533.1 carboxylic ester hydrolase [Phytomonospora endophytica]